MGDKLEIMLGTDPALPAVMSDPGATVGDVLTVQTDKSIAAAPSGGGSQPTEVVSAIGFDIPSGEIGLPSFTKVSGDDLLDLTTPTVAVVVAAGTYLLTYGLAVGSDVTYLLPVNATSVSGNAIASAPPDGTADAANFPAAGASEVAVLAEGDQVNFTPVNPNVAGTLEAAVYMTVTKLA